MAEDNVSATLTVAAPAERVFAVLADPTAHAAIDGTGWVQQSVDRAPLTEVGQIFRMDMYHPNHPNGDYQTVNKVQVLGPPRTIGWLTGYRKDDGELDFGGWIWRYDLAPLGPSETEVTLTYDWSGCRSTSGSTSGSRRSARSISPTRCTTWPGSSTVGDVSTRNEDAGRRRPTTVGSLIPAPDRRRWCRAHAPAVAAGSDHVGRPARCFHGRLVDGVAERHDGLARVGRLPERGPREQDQPRTWIPGRAVDTPGAAFEAVRLGPDVGVHTCVRRLGVAEGEPDRYVLIARGVLHERRTVGLGGGWMRPVTGGGQIETAPHHTDPGAMALEGRLPRFESAGREIERRPHQPSRVAVPGAFDLIVLELPWGTRDLADQRGAWWAHTELAAASQNDA